MKMIAASKLRRAQDALIKLRPYAERIYTVLSSLAARIDPNKEIHPLLKTRRPKQAGLLILTSDRGLCGGFNININRRAHQYIKENSQVHEKIKIITIGKKARDYFRYRGFEIAHEFHEVFERLDWDKAAKIAALIMEDYIQGRLDVVYLIYNEFKTVITQRVVFEPILPIQSKKFEEGERPQDFIYEPSQRALLAHLLPMYVEVQVFRALLESVASEHGARMTAMDAATKNAEEMLQQLTLEYNQARQAAITKELLEIVGGAEVLRGELR
jgi:F-type H+-transporting ATPase subunit gamma